MSTTRTANPEATTKLNETANQWEAQSLFFKTYKVTKPEDMVHLGEEEQVHAKSVNQLARAVHRTMLMAGAARDSEMERELLNTNCRTRCYSVGDWTVIKYRTGTIKLINNRLMKKNNDDAEAETINLYDHIEF